MIKKKKKYMDLSGFEPEASSMIRIDKMVDKDTLNEYISIKKLSGVSDKHIYEGIRFLKKYLEKYKWFW
jgi:hypothetical protein